METRFGEITVTHSARGVPSYRVEVFHDGLHKYTVIRAADQNIFRNKCLAQAQQWNSAWQKLSVYEQNARQVESQKETALERTVEAQHLLESLRNILVNGIETAPTLDWEQLKNRTIDPANAPAKPVIIPEPLAGATPIAPERWASRYQVKLSIVDHLIASRKVGKLRQAEERFNADLSAWRYRCEELSTIRAEEIFAIRVKNAALQEKYARAVHEWEQREYEEQAKQHAEIDEQRTRYESKVPDAVIEYCERVLSSSDYPDCIPREFDFDLNPQTGVMLVECKLPAPEMLPRLVEVKYVKTTDTLTEKYLSEAQSARLYDDVLYQITLRTIHELFQSDSVNAISTIVLNGIVTSTDRSTGNETTACVLSVQVSRDVFLAINLAKVDPKACFRQLKGVGSATLHSITPIAPIVKMKRDDRRFVAPYHVADTLNEGSNLATMEWEDFEHLIREIFQREFSSNGGEVKVTQASRDGGVDAVAFDPDPIRGGKIVIQAKRYSYTVEISAVRDLYGTVMNEGATKGILVTTSDYGPDAYEFANGKPLTLLSGSNLLHLLAKHGVHAHINLVEGRQVARERFGRGSSQIEKSR